MDTKNTNGWTEYRRQVLQELETLHEGQKELKQHVVSLQIEMAVAKTKLALVSVVASAVTSAIVVSVVKLILK